jgi:hypothetical protein
MATGTRAEKAERARAARDRALRRLEIPGTLDHAFRGVGGRETAIAMARLGSHRDGELKEFVRSWDELDPKAQLEPRLLERLALGVGLHPAELFGRISATAYKHNFDVAQMTAAMKLGEILERRAEFAMDKDGHKDAELVLKAGGLLQTGPLVTVNQTQQTLNVAAGLPPVEELTGRVSELIRPAEHRPMLPGVKDYIDVGFEPIEKKEEYEKSQP